MSAELKKTQESQEFGLTLSRKIVYAVVLLGISMLVIPLSPLFVGTVGTILFVLFGIALGVTTWFVSAGWTYKLEVAGSEIKIRDGHRHITVPMERLGLVAKNGRIPVVPTIWLVLRGAEVGQEIPAKGVDPVTREMIETLRKRSPGKKITYVPVPGGYLRSISGFVAELKRRIPPLTVDERLGGK